jgi:hypothetical protein
MKTTIVPAQVTTVEDKIAGNLGVSQLLLLIAPLFGGGLIFAFLPAFFGYETYKVVLTVILAAVCGFSAIRIKGKILLWWVVILFRYNWRPKYYLFNKNDTYLRAVEPMEDLQDAKEEAQSKRALGVQASLLSPTELVQVEGLLANPELNLRFATNKKGELTVYATEID